MSSGPFDINLVVARLQELDPQPFSQIGTIVEYSKVTDLSGFAMPGAYVLMGTERGIQGKGARAQNADAVIGIAISVRNYGMGAEGLTHEVNPLIGQVRDHLIGWRPTPASATGMQWLRGDVLDFDGGMLLWMDTFQVQHVIGGRRCLK